MGSGGGRNNMLNNHTSIHWANPDCGKFSKANSSGCTDQKGLKIQVKQLQCRNSAESWFEQSSKIIMKQLRKSEHSLDI